MPILSREKQNATGARLARASKKELVLKITHAGMHAPMHAHRKKKKKNTFYVLNVYISPDPYAGI